MSANANNSYPILGWSASTWYLLTATPNNIPETHRLREISHEEFKVLSCYLDVYRSSGKIVVRDAVDAVILHRLTGFQIDQSSWKKSDGYCYDKIPQNLGNNDHVLVAHGTTSGMYVQISYSRAERAKFREMVLTGIIEPKTITYPPISKMFVLAERVSRNKKRITGARRLMKSHRDSDDEYLTHIKLLISRFVEQNDSEIRASQVTPRMIDDAISRIEVELQFIAAEHKQSILLMQIDSSLHRDERDMDYCDETTAHGRIEAIQQNILQHNRVLENLKTLRECLLNPLGGEETSP